MTFKEALNLVRVNRDNIDIQEMSEKNGLTKKYLNLCLDGAIKEGKPVVVSIGLRRKFIDEVVNLNL